MLQGLDSETKSWILSLELEFLARAWSRATTLSKTRSGKMEPIFRVLAGGFKQQ